MEKVTVSPSRLEKIATGVAGAIVSTEYALCYNNFNGLHASGINAPDRFRWLPISQSYFGDAPEIFATILASGFVANKIEEYGKTRENKFIESCGRHLPTLTAAIVGTYYALGETILPQLLSGTADAKDVPAVVLTALASQFVANYVRKKWKSTWKEKMKHLVNSVNDNFAPHNTLTGTPSVPTIHKP